MYDMIIRYIQYTHFRGSPSRVSCAHHEALRKLCPFPIGMCDKQASNESSLSQGQVPVRYGLRERELDVMYVSVKRSSCPLKL